MGISVTTAQRLSGSVWGHLVGDAVGVPYEFMSPRAISHVEFGAVGTHRQPPGTWSDDGALMLALLDSLTRDGANDRHTFDTADQARRFLAWADERDYTPDRDGKFDIGNATSAALAALRRGTSPEQAGGTDDHANGNGSLMRILSLALVEREVDGDTLVEHAHRSSAITHGHAYARATCALYVLVARRLLAGSSRAKALKDARSQARHLYTAHADAATWLAALDHIEGYRERTGSGYVVNAFWSAWDALAGAKDYRTTIERAIRYGHDTDTTACIAGGLAGLRWGIDGIPADWLAGMRGRDIVEPLVARLTGEFPRRGERSRTSGRTSVSHPIRVDWVDGSAVPSSAGWTGRLGMTFLPGKDYPGHSGHRHERDTDMDLDRLRGHWGVDVFVLLVEDHEFALTKTVGIVDEFPAHDIELIRFPIVDMHAPTDTDAVAELLECVQRQLADGQGVVVACLGGLGRTGTIVACLLEQVGLSADDAIALTRRTRHGTIQSREQERFVRDWSRRVSAR